MADPSRAQQVLRLFYDEGQPHVTRTYVAYRLGVSGPEAEALLEEMTSEGLIELDSDGEGNLHYRLPAAEEGRQVPHSPPPPMPAVPAWNPNAPPVGGWGPPPNPAPLVPAPRTDMIPVSDRSRLVTLLLCWFMGPLGIHRFYAGRNASGLLFLFTFGFLGLGVLLDLISIATGGFRDEHGRPIVNW